MKYSRVVIERIPIARQRAAMPDATLDERIESQTPVSGWLDLLDAMQLNSWLRTNRPILFDHDGSMVIYSLQHAELNIESLPPSPFDIDAVRSFPRFDAEARSRLSLAKEACAKALRWIEDPDPKKKSRVKAALKAIVARD